MVMDPRTEDLFRGVGGRDPRALSRVTDRLESETRRAVEVDEPPLLVVAPDIRRAVAEVAKRHVPGLTVMSYREVDQSVPFVARSVIAAQEVAQ
jgi:flagellar biosynthesis component FlhA